MRKLLGAALSLVLVGAVSSARAELLKNLKTSGEVEVHAVGSTNLTDFSQAQNDRDGRATTRVLLNGMFDLSDEASANVSLVKNDRTYGSTAQPGQSLTAVQGVVAFSQANMVIKNVLGLDHKLGRQYYGRNGDLVIYLGPSRGPTIRNLPVTAIDAYTAWWKGDKMDGNVIIGKITDNTPAGGGQTPGGDTDLDLRGVEVNCTHMDAANLRLQVYNAHQHAAGPVGSLDTTVISPSVMGKVMNGDLNYKAQVTYNTGLDGSGVCTGGGGCTEAGYSALVNADYTLSFMGKVKIMAEVGYGSGNDPTSPSDKDKKAQYIASDYRPGDIFGGNVGGLGTTLPGGALNPANGGLGDLTTFNLGFNHTWDKWPKLSWGVQYYNFSLTKQPTTTTTDKGLGSEVDLRAKWQNSDNVAVAVGWGQFMAGQAVKDALGGSADAIRQYYANFTVKF